MGMCLGSKMDEQQLRSLSLFNLEKRKLRGGLMVAYKSSWGQWWRSTDFCSLVTGNDMELDIRWRCFTRRVVGPRNRLPLAMITAPSLWELKKLLNSTLRYRIWILGGSVWNQELDLIILMCPFQHKIFYYSNPSFKRGSQLTCLWQHLFFS